MKQPEKRRKSAKRLLGKNRLRMAQKKPLRLRLGKGKETHVYDTRQFMNLKFGRLAVFEDTLTCPESPLPVKLERASGTRLIETEQSLETCTLRSRFGHLTANGNPLFAVSGFTLPVCSYLGITIRGW